MKLAEALSLRKSILNELNNYSTQIIPSLSHEEGDQQEEIFANEERTFGILCSKYEELICNINRTNNSTKIPSGSNLMEALSNREALNIKINLYNSLVSQYRYKDKKVVYGNVTVNTIIDVPLTSIKGSLNKLQEKLRVLDSEIQSTNWTTDLLLEEI